MKAMKNIIIYILFVMAGLSAYSQQNPLYTQYMFNPFVVNPALTGTHDYYQVWLNSRMQWVGMTDAPVTNTLSIYGPLENHDMGVGGYVYSDITGPTSRLGANGAYAYNLAINEDLRLSMGIFAGFVQYKMDKTQIEFEQPESDFFTKEVYFLPDASVGVYMYNNFLHVGISATQLFNSKLDFIQEAFDTEEDSLKYNSVFGRLKSHFYLTGGYRYFFSSDIAIEPTLIMRIVAPSSPQVDFNVRVIYQNMVWGGVAFRSQDALSFIAGYAHDKKIFLGMSYDIGVNKLSPSHIGSFEVVVGFLFDSIKL